MAKVTILSALLIGCVLVVAQDSLDIPNLILDEGLTSLYDAVVDQGLAELLSSDGPFTVFAPTDDAFAAVSVDSSELADVLAYHVLNGKVMSSDITNDLTANSYGGKPIRFNIYSNGVYTAQCAPIDLDRVDLMASNGVVHVLDAVMIPPGGDIVAVLAADSRYSTLVTAVTAAGLVDTLKGAGPYTVFAPTNDAFDKLDPADLEALLADTDALTAVLLKHVVSGTFCSSGLSSGTVPSVGGDDLSIMVSSSGVMVDDSNVIEADISVTNGVIHGIDTVL